jgi:hypothetical protein
VYARDGAGTWSQQAYVKASNAEAADDFGWSVTLSGDGNTLAVGAPREDSDATGVGGSQANSIYYPSAGAVYVFVRDGVGVWAQHAYVKASNTHGGDNFGYEVALSGDANTLAVSALFERSGATGVGGNQDDHSTANAGAVYVLVRDGAGVWSQQAYVKASNTAASDFFGNGLDLSEDGSTLAVGAHQEDGNASGIGGNQANNASNLAGAAYVYTRNGAAWSHRAYVKPSSTGAGDMFGWGLALSGSGSTLAVGAYWQDGAATGVGGDQALFGEGFSGAVFLY